MRADVNVTHFNASQPGTVTNPMADADQRITRGMTSLSVENNYGRTSGALSLFYNWGRHKIDDGYAAGSEPLNYRFNSRDRMLGVSWYQSAQLFAGNRLTGEMKASERQILGGGVYCAGELELCGTTNLTGNRAQDAQNNLWLDETGTVTIGTLGLDKQARIGVSGQAEQAVLTGYADDFSENFTSDDPTLCISAVHENGFTDLQLQEAVYTLTLVTDENDEPVTLEAEQGKSLADLYVNDPEREDAAFDGWYTEDEEPVDTQQPLHLTADTTLYAHWTQASDEEAAPLPDYAPDTPLTRQEAAKTLYQMAKQLGLDTEAGADVDLTQFTDADEIGADAEDAVRWAYASDLLTEKDGKLRVQEELSRKELSRMLEDLLALSSAD